MRIIGRTSLVALAIVALPASAIADEPLRFQFEPQAQQHCPGDSVIWADAALRLYNVKDERWYGNTKSGAYACLREVEKAGYRARRTTSSSSSQ